MIETYRNDQAKLKSLQRRGQGLQEVLNEMLIALESVKEIQKASKDENMLVSLGAGVYAEAKIANTKTLKTSLAGRILVEAEADKTIEKFEKDIERARKDISATEAEMQKVTQNLQNVARIIQAGQESIQENAQKPEEANSVS